VCEWEGEGIAHEKKKKEGAEESLYKPLGNLDHLALDRYFMARPPHRGRGGETALSGMRRAMGRCSRDSTRTASPCRRAKLHARGAVSQYSAVSSFSQRQASSNRPDLDAAALAQPYSRQRERASMAGAPRSQVLRLLAGGVE